MKSAPLAEILFQEPHRFDFFQAVRILERVAAEEAKTSDSKSHSASDDSAQKQTLSPSRHHSVGEDYAPRQESVRFRVVPSQSFPAGVIVELRPCAKTESNPETTPPEMVVAFLGLTGPNGVLPRHYTSQLIERVRAKDYALRDFLDLFHHRILSLFYRAWEKYRFPITYERLAHEEPSAQGDLFTDCLYALLGLGTKKLRGRMAYDDEAFLYYGGFFAHSPRNAISLEAMLADYFEQTVRILQFHGQWLYLSRDDQSALPNAELPDGLNCQLGRNVVIGERVWDVEGKFRIRVGPLSFADFQRFMPIGDALLPLCQMVRSYAGPQFDFDVQPVLRASEVPWCQLGGESSSPAQLGWNTWIRSGEFINDVSDAVFVRDYKWRVASG